MLFRTHYYCIISSSSVVGDCYITAPHFLRMDHLLDLSDKKESHREM